MDASSRKSKRSAKGTSRSAKGTSRSAKGTSRSAKGTSRSAKRTSRSAKRTGSAKGTVRSAKGTGSAKGTVRSAKGTGSAKSTVRSVQIKKSQSPPTSPKIPSQPNIQSLELSPLANSLLIAARTAFPELQMETDPGKYDDSHTNRKYDHVHGLICADKSKCECFALKVYHREDEDLSYPDQYILVDRIKYKYGDECAHSGTDILVRLTRMFRSIGVPRVQLYDAAKIHVSIDGEPRDFKLSTYNILLHGVSWYNRYGYVSDTHEREVAKNRVVIEKKLPPSLKKSMNAELAPDSIPNDATFGKFAQMVDAFRRTGSEDQKTKYLKAYLLMDAYLTTAKQDKIAYAWYDLKLR